MYEDNKTTYLSLNTNALISKGICTFADVMHSISELESELIEEFSLFDNWMDRYQYIIEMGQNLPPLDEAHKQASNLVHGCQSQVWLVAEEQDGKLMYFADSDAIITKGLIAMLMRVLSGHEPKDIIQTELRFVDAVGIREHLSPTRSNGLNNMIKQMKYYALAFEARRAKES